MLTEFKRIKHGQQPGDVSKRTKIKMREKKIPAAVSPWQTITAPQAKAFRRFLQHKSKKRQRQRDKEVIANAS